MALPAGRRDRGSALMLMPAGLLIVLVLASIAIDMTVVHLRQRQAMDVAASAANDAVTAGADPSGLRSGVYRVDPAAARRVVQRAVAASDLASHLAAAPRVSVTGDTVAVRLTVKADYIFTAALPGAPGSTTVTATASATAVSP